MAFIQITQIKGGQAGCFDYFFKDGERILVGEFAYVPDEQLQAHLDTQLVSQVSTLPKDAVVVNPQDLPQKGR